MSYKLASKTFKLALLVSSGQMYLPKLFMFIIFHNRLYMITCKYYKWKWFLSKQTARLSTLYYILIVWYHSAHSEITALFPSQPTALSARPNGDEWASSGEDHIRVPANLVTCQLEWADWCWNNVEESPIHSEEASCYTVGGRILSQLRLPWFWSVGI